MKRPRARRLLPLAALLLAAAPLSAEPAVEAYKAMGIRVEDVLSGTALNAQVIPGDVKEQICVTTYFTGKKEKEDAVNVRLDVLRPSGDRLVAVHTRDFGQEQGGNVGRGNLQVIDLDMDGINEIIVTYESYGDPLIEQTLAEVIVWDENGFRTAWSGPIKYDSTRAARSVPEERRDRYQREFDIAGTLRTRGATLVVNKRVIAVAGQRLPEPKVVQEAFPLRSN
jgi:hypothetical protein